MRLMLSALTLAASAGLAAAQGVPQFDAAPGCRAGANTGVTRGNNIDGCIKSEMDARAQLVRDWNAFPVADRAHCASLARMGTTPSYIEVLTCLEMARDVRQLPKDDNTGLNAGQRR
jgi:hypothetical protein